MTDLRMISTGERIKQVSKQQVFRNQIGEGEICIPLPSGERLGEGCPAMWVRHSPNPCLKGRGIIAALLCSLVAFLLNAQVEAAENWTRFRGPNGTGIASDVSFPATWSENDYAWKIKLPGKGHSSPVGWGEKLFITSGDVETGDITLHCLNAESGTEIWKQTFAGGTYSLHAGNTYASSTPAIDEKLVYFTWSTGGHMHCAALTHDGDDAWNTELGDFAGPHGFGASPMVVDGVVCMQVDQGESGELVGLDAPSGSFKWRVPRSAGKASYATPCMLPRKEQGPTVVVSQSMEGGLQLIDLQSGDIVWENAEAFPARCVSSPVLMGTTLVSICGGGGRGKLLLGYDVSDSVQQPMEKLSLKKQLPYVPTPVKVGEQLLLWGDSGVVSMLDLSSETPPKKAAWRERIGGKYFGSPILAGDKVYCMSMEGRAVVLAASNEYQLLGDNDLGEPSNATPAVHQGRLYLRTESTLACLEQKK